MSLLDKSYIVTNFKGNVYVIDNIELYLHKVGTSWFSRNFGLEFNWKPGFGCVRGNFSTAIILLNYYVHEFDYVLEDLSGKKIDPKNILDEYLAKYPKKPRTKICKSGTVRTKRWYQNYVSRYKKPSRYRLLKQQMICKDEMEPDIRNKSKTGYFGYYDDEGIERDRQRNWKSYRKTQYK
jgi:hypothetical protein